MVTVFTAPALVLGAGLGGSSVAVAAAALIVVVTIVLVFVMVLRSNGSGRRAASGLGYDAQRPPLGQPQNAPDGAWQRPGGHGMPQPGWGAGSEMPGMGGMGGMGGMPASHAAPGGWGQQDFAASPGTGPAAQAQQQWGAPQAPAAWGDAAGAGAWGAQHTPSADAWGAPAAGGWNSAPGPASRPGGASTSPAWDAPAAAQPSMGGWGASATPQAASPWDQPESNAPAWGAQQPAAAASPQWGGAAGGGMPGGWGGGMQSPQMGQMGQMGQSGQSGQDWGSAPVAPPASMPQYDGSPFGDDKTRIARPAGGQQRAGMIVVRQGKEPGRIFEIRKDRLTIGRSRESDIFLEDLAVSRLHTSVSRDESGRFLLRDEGSANGTYVNGQRVSEQVLEEGDEVQVGQTVLAFVRR